MVTLIHKLTKLSHFLFFRELRRVACRLEVSNSLALSEHMHRAFIEEKLRILCPNLLNVRYIVNKLPTIVAAGFLFDLLGSIASWAQLLTYKL